MVMKSEENCGVNHGIDNGGDCVALFDMPNLNRFNILSISIFCKIALSISISILIFSKITISISILISIFSKMTISILISISIFFKSVDISTIDISYRYFNKEKE